MERLRIAASATILHPEWIRIALDFQQRINGVEEMTNAFSFNSCPIEIVWHRWSRVGR